MTAKHFSLEKYHLSLACHMNRFGKKMYNKRQKDVTSALYQDLYLAYTSRFTQGFTTSTVIFL